MSFCFPSEIWSWRSLRKDRQNSCGGCNSKTSLACGYCSRSKQTGRFQNLRLHRSVAAALKAVLRACLTICCAVSAHTNHFRIKLLSYLCIHLHPSILPDSGKLMTLYSFKGRKQSPGYDPKVIMSFLGVESICMPTVCLICKVNEV